jgi:hypothetical protein
MNLDKDNGAMRGLARSLQSAMPQSFKGRIECRSDDGGETVTVTALNGSAQKQVTAPWDKKLEAQAVAALARVPRKRKPRRKAKAKTWKQRVREWITRQIAKLKEMMRPAR